MRTRYIIIIIVAVLVLAALGIGVYIWTLPDRVTRQVQAAAQLVNEMYILQVKVATTEKLTISDSNFPLISDLPGISDTTYATRRNTYFVHVMGHVFSDVISDTENLSVTLDGWKIVVIVPPLEMNVKVEPGLSYFSSEVELEWWVELLTDIAVNKVSGAVIKGVGVPAIRAFWENAPEGQLNTALEEVADIVGELIGEEISQGLAAALDADPARHTIAVEQAQNAAVQLMCQDDYQSFYQDRYKQLLELYLNDRNILPVEVMVPEIECP